MSAKRKEVGYKIIGLTTEDTEKSGICTTRREKKNMAIPLAHCFAWGAARCVGGMTITEKKIKEEKVEK